MLLQIALVAALACPAVAQETSAPEWITSHAIRLTTPEAGHGFSDMQPLKKVIGNARIVSLGEATHGTREFFELKHRMVEFLASEMGFSVFAIEANMPEAYRLNDYVLRGEGDPARLLKGMYMWTWDTAEVLNMIRWMREFNKSGKGRIEFTGFDMQTPSVAEDVVRDFVRKRDPAYTAAVRAAIEAEGKTKLGPAGPNFATLEGTIPIAIAAGKRIRFTGYIKTENVADDSARLWLRVDGPGSKMLAFDNMQNRGAKGTSDWKEYSIELPVAAEATGINFGMMFHGSGTAWFDDLRIELNGHAYEAAPRFDLGFESGKVKGFTVEGQGHQVQLDTSVFHGGKQGLRMHVTPRVRSRNTLDPKISAAAWQDVMAHLETSRAGYRQIGVSDSEIDWALQNARIMVQCMMMRANLVSRDRSMAENVKWIADHSPGARIILWAHNIHVAAGGLVADSMGATLRKMFGENMVVFGFGFNQGSFQSVTQGKGGLRDFTVPPAPEGSLDSTLAAAGIPLFALDLRQTPQTGPVVDWLSQPLQTRSIGGYYPEDSPFAFMTTLKARAAFDALLYVANTNAARKNLVAANDHVRYLTKTAGDLTEYDDPNYAVSLALPANWKLVGARHWGDQQATVELSGPKNQIGSLYFQQANKVSSALEVEPFWASEVDAMVAQRVREGITDYRIPPESCEARAIGGRRALACSAQFTQDGHKTIEYLVYIASANMTARFSARIAAAEFESVRQQLEEIADTIRTP